MATAITMPKLGLTMTSGSVKEWKKKVGDTVKKGEILFVVATDKLTVDSESPADGVLLAITVKEGVDVPVGERSDTWGPQGRRSPRKRRDLPLPLNLQRQRLPQRLPILSGRRPLLLRPPHPVPSPRRRRPRGWHGKRGWISPPYRERARVAGWFRGMSWMLRKGVPPRLHPSLRGWRGKRDWISLRLEPRDA